MQNTQSAPQHQPTLERAPGQAAISINTNTGETYPAGSVWMGSTSWMSQPMAADVLKQRRGVQKEAPPKKVVGRGHDEHVASAADPSSPEEQMPITAQVGAAVKLATAAECAGIPSDGLIDTDNAFCTAVSSCTINNLQASSDSKIRHMVQDTTLGRQRALGGSEEVDAVIRVKRAGSRRRSITRLSEAEREMAMAIGVLGRTRESTSRPVVSVLDNYEPIGRGAKGSRQPQVPRTTLAKRVVEQGNKCKYCDRAFGSCALIDGELERLEARPDHFRPIAERRNDNLSNIFAACHICNRLKSSRLFVDVEEVRAVLQAAWLERGWKSAPPLVPFRPTEIYFRN